MPEALYQQADIQDSYYRKLPQTLGSLLGILSENTKRTLDPLYLRPKLWPLARLFWGSSQPFLGLGSGPFIEVEQIPFQDASGSFMVFSSFSTFLAGFKTLKFQNSKSPKFQNSKIPKFQNSEIPRLEAQKQTAICKYPQHNMQQRIQIGIGRLETNSYLQIPTTQHATQNSDVLTGQKQTAISCRYPQHNVQHRMRMGIDRLETNSNFLQIPATQHATQNSDGY